MDPEPEPEPNDIDVMLISEASTFNRGFPNCPRLITTVDIQRLAKHLRIEPVNKVYHKNGFEVIFVLSDDNVSYMTRAIQEDQILGTRFTTKHDNKQVDIPSFWDVWEKNPNLCRKITASSDPHEAKWKCRREFGYRMATTFMPSYAKCIYEHFGAKRVLDPCAGWGDRMIGANAAKCVETYIGFDPNRALRPGYAKLMQAMGNTVSKINDSEIDFSNSSVIISKPFEIGCGNLKSNSFDLVFTSPPFFDYEIYTPSNPKYTNWIDEFYKPLFVEASRCVVAGGHVAIHIGDTSAGFIESFLKNDVCKTCPLRLVYKIGLQGIMSTEMRSVWVFQKAGGLSSSVHQESRREKRQKINCFV